MRDTESNERHPEQPASQAQPYLSYPRCWLMGLLQHIAELKKRAGCVSPRFVLAARRSMRCVEVDQSRARCSRSRARTCDAVAMQASALTLNQKLRVGMKGLLRAAHGVAAARNVFNSLASPSESMSNCAVGLVTACISIRVAEAAVGSGSPAWCTAD